MDPNRDIWSKEEDSSLLLFSATLGTSGFWTQIAAMMNARSGKECRERYMNHLDPDMKRTPWTKQEDDVIRDLFPSKGSDWSQYMEYLPNRSNNAIKNRYRVISSDNFNPSYLTSTGLMLSCPEEISCESGDQNEDGIDSSPQQKRLKRLHAAREQLDQRIQELVETVAFVTCDELSTILCVQGSDFNLSTAFCEQGSDFNLSTAYCEPGSDFEGEDDCEESG